MATGPEHYGQAESDLDTAARASDRGREGDATFWMQAAQVHATLALAAATALGHALAPMTTPPAEVKAWTEAAGTPAPGPIEMRQQS